MVQWIRITCTYLWQRIPLIQSIIGEKKALERGLEGETRYSDKIRSERPLGTDVEYIDAVRLATGPGGDRRILQIETTHVICH